MSGCAMPGIPTAFVGLSTLTFLNFAGNRLSGSVPSTLSGLPLLQCVWIVMQLDPSPSPMLMHVTHVPDSCLALWSRHPQKPRPEPELVFWSNAYSIFRPVVANVRSPVGVSVLSSFAIVM